MSLMGTRVKRVEDARLLTAGGTYIDDVEADDAAHVVFVRATVAHASFCVTDRAAALAAPGVLGVHLFEDLALEPAGDPDISTMFALLAFYVASAAFRAFRAKNLEAMLLLVTALIVLIGQTKDREITSLFLPTPADGSLPWMPIADLTEFIRKTFVTAGQRAIMIGVALGVVATSLRILLGQDRSYLGGDE